MDYFYGLSLDDVREIIDLCIDDIKSHVNKDDITVKEHTVIPNHSVPAGHRLQIDIPFDIEGQFPAHRELDIYAYGLVRMDNGLGVDIPLNNAFKIYEIIIKNMNPTL